MVASPVPSLDVNPSTVNVGTATSTSTTWEALTLGINNCCTGAAFLAAPV